MASLSAKRPGLAVTVAILAVAVAATNGGCDESVELTPPVPGSGKVTILESGGPEGDTGWWPSLVLDSAGRPHLTYCDANHGDLKYATKKGGAWHIESVVSRGAVGKYTAVAIDAKGTIGVAFYDQDTKYLRYAWRAPAGTRAPPTSPAVEPGDNGWLTERIAWGLEVGMASELRFDHEDVPHLFYYIPSGKLIHAYRRAGEWQKEKIADATGSFSIRIDPVLRPDGFWLTFVHWTFKDTTLYLAHQRPDGGFAREVVANELGPGWRSSLLFAGDAPEILYTLSRKPGLHIATRGEEGWQHRLVMPEVANFSAARAHDGTVVVAYEDIHRGTTGKGIVRLLRFTPTADPIRPRRFDLDPTGPTGAYLSLVLNRRGEALLAYYAGDIRGLKIYDESEH